MNRTGHEPRTDCGVFLRRCASERRRLAYLEGVIPLLARRLRELRQESPYASIRVTQRWADITSSCRFPGDPTAAVAVRAADAAGQAELRETERRLRDLTFEKETLLRRQEWADCFLRALAEDQQFLVETRLLQGQPWSRVETQYEARFGVRYHRDTLRRRLAAAVQMLNGVTRWAE